MALQATRSTGQELQTDDSSSCKTHPTFQSTLESQSWKETHSNPILLPLTPGHFLPWPLPPSLIFRTEFRHHLLLEVFPDALVSFLDAPIIPIPDSIVSGCLFDSAS